MNVHKNQILDHQLDGLLAFPAGKPLYAEIAEWRKILARLACFLRSVDYTLQELMRHLVFSSVQQLLDHLVTSYHAPEEEDVENSSAQVRRLVR